jgi:3-oxoacyl-[acyl-carrier-protein] synthase II
MNNNRIFITGIGIISALGNSLDETYKSLLGNQICPGKIDFFDCSIDKPFFKTDLPAFPSNKKMRTKQLADIAFSQAIDQAKLQDNESGKLNIGICCGTTVASQLNNIEFYRQFREDKIKSYDPVKQYLAGNISETLVREHNFSGPGLNIVNACSSGSDAIGIAMTWIQKGICDVVIAGGADELNIVPIAGFNSLGILSDSICKPFDKNRDGLNLGEGAAFLVLEKESTAKSRKAEMLAECCSYSTAADAYHLTTPRPDGLGLQTAIEKALFNADIKEENIDFINAHGTATRSNDAVEGNLFKKIFNHNTKIFSIKGYTGHTLGAAGAIDAVLTVLSLQKQWIPKNAGFSQEDPDIGFSPVSKSNHYQSEYALSTSLAFGGQNSAIIFRRV